MWKKLSVVGMSSALALSLAACGSESSSTEGKSSAKSDVIEASIKDATYVISSEDDGQSVDSETGLLEVDVKVTNKTNSSIMLDSYDGVKLYDGDEQIEPENVYDTEVGLDDDSSGTIGGKKVKNVKYYFNVEKDKSYEVGLKPRTKDVEDEAEEVMLKLDTKKYDDSFEALQDPAKAVEAYVKTLYFGEEDKNYDKLVSADKEKIEEQAKEAFVDRMSTATSGTNVDDSEMNKMYDTYKATLAEKAKLEPRVVARGKDKAEVKLKYSSVSLSDVYDALGDYAKEYMEQNATYDREAAYGYAVTKFDKIMEDTDAKNSSYDMTIDLKLKDGKWEIDSSAVKDFNTAFGEGLL
ncbi:DUF5105 domain-containing protein [Priestia endophytica]